MHHMRLRCKRILKPKQNFSKILIEFNKIKFHFSRKIEKSSIEI